MCVSDGRVLRFNRLLGEGWRQEAVGDGFDQLGMSHLLFSLGADCRGDRAVGKYLR